MADELACWLCGRAIETRLQWHHPVPKSKKGRETVPVHPICHRAIHAHFTNAELGRFGEDRARLLEDEELARFVAWIQGKPADFHAPYRR
ncbi:HNH endonuclease [Erythrobacter litoralis]|uniref:HNH endonuclease n=1 Tax=Erythrobacter litoralis (strain HTCC2594) TaxID=314225 RepID=Q2N8Y8_ERYLH|nr:HNH endonuclease [Erythrobacter litoralis]ABC63853.1 hypothetical protein ELI_08805 [Erythrobacter litoralis HTCC2594]